MPVGPFAGDRHGLDAEPRRNDVEQRLILSQQALHLGEVKRAGAGERSILGERPRDPHVEIAGVAQDRIALAGVLLEQGQRRGGGDAGAGQRGVSCGESLAERLPLADQFAQAALALLGIGAQTRLDHRLIDRSGLGLLQRDERLVGKGGALLRGLQRAAPCRLGEGLEHLASFFLAILGDIDGIGGVGEAKARRHLRAFAPHPQRLARRAEGIAGLRQQKARLGQRQRGEVDRAVVAIDRRKLSGSGLQDDVFAISRTARSGKDEAEFGGGVEEGLSRRTRLAPRRLDDRTKRALGDLPPLALDRQISKVVLCRQGDWIVDPPNLGPIGDHRAESGHRRLAAPLRQVDRALGEHQVKSLAGDDPGLAIGTAANRADQIARLVVASQRDQHVGQAERHAWSQIGELGNAVAQPQRFAIGGFPFAETVLGYRQFGRADQQLNLLDPRARRRQQAHGLEAAKENLFGLLDVAPVSEDLGVQGVRLPRKRLRNRGGPRRWPDHASDDRFGRGTATVLVLHRRKHQRGPVDIVTRHPAAGVGFRNRLTEQGYRFVEAVAPRQRARDPLLCLEHRRRVLLRERVHQRDDFAVVLFSLVPARGLERRLCRAVQAVEPVQRTAGQDSHGGRGGLRDGAVGRGYREHCHKEKEERTANLLFSLFQATSGMLPLQHGAEQVWLYRPLRLPWLSVARHASQEAE